jgi:hypothetical protein
MVGCEPSGDVERRQALRSILALFGATPAHTMLIAHNKRRIIAIQIDERLCLIGRKSVSGKTLLRRRRTQKKRVLTLL